VSNRARAQDITLVIFRDISKALGEALLHDPCAISRCRRRVENLLEDALEAAKRRGEGSSGCPF
jgi:hypothetical protein